MSIPFETFAPLAALPGFVHAFSLRTDENTRADDYPKRFIASLGWPRFASAGQPHSNVVALATEARHYPAADALITSQPGLALLVRCADCAPIYLVTTPGPAAEPAQFPDDRPERWPTRNAAIGLIHSGKRGTLANVVEATVTAMERELGVAAGNLRALIGPCIGPCHYDTDIWTAVKTQLRDAGVTDVHHPRLCTACHLDRYYSYRAEKGQTGRHFGLLAIR